MNCATLNDVRHGVLRATTSATIVATACSSSAMGSPMCSRSAKTNAVEVLTPLASRVPAMTSGRISPITMRTATAMSAPRIIVKSEPTGSRS